jgi:hypothetical protein
MRPIEQLGEAALAYASLGYRVLPLHHPVPTSSAQGPGMLCSCGDLACGGVGKHPLTPHGLNDATGDPARLARWWRRWPQANIGLVTGELVDVLDIDGPAGRAALRRFAADHDFRLDGPLAQTGSGWHYYVAPTGSGNRAGLLEQVDWRGRGGYVVAPPSRHATGRHYRWLRPPTATLPRVPPPLRRLLDPAQAQVDFPPVSTSRGEGHKRHNHDRPRRPGLHRLSAIPTARPPSPKNLPRSPTPPMAAATTPSTRPGSVSTAWSPAASSTTPTSKPAYSPPPRPAGCWPRSQTRPAAR